MLKFDVDVDYERILMYVENLFQIVIKEMYDVIRAWFFFNPTCNIP